MKKVVILNDQVIKSVFDNWYKVSYSKLLKL